MNVTIIPVGMLGTNCYLLTTQSGGCALIDPGGQPEKIASILEEKGCQPKYILLTHGHYDHTGGVKALMEKYPEAECLIGKADKELLVDQEKSTFMLRGMDWDNFYLPEVKEIEEGEEFTLDNLTIRVLETPGHSLGGVCYICGEVIFSGDTLFLENVGRCDLYGGDFDSLRKSLKKLSELAGDYTVYPGHGEPTTLAHERQHNPYMSGG